MKILAVFFVGVFLVASCAPPAPDVAEVRKTIEGLTEQAEKDMIAGTIDSTMANYTDDAVSLPNNGPMLKGKKAIKDHYTQMMGMGIKFPMVDFKTLDVQVSGSMAFEYGSYAMTIEMTGMPPMNDEGKYLTVYERGVDGKWRTKVETWNTNMMPPMPEAKTAESMPGGKKDKKK